MAFMDNFKSKWERMKDWKSVPKTPKNTATPVASVSVAAKKSSRPAMDASRTAVILQPLVTEKTATLASHGKYTFVVKRGATKLQVRSAIKAKYGILPIGVHIQNQRGKQVRFGGRVGKQAAWKKAIITLPSGKTLDIYEGV